MRTVTNKTTRPITVPLPRAKKLHLGPLKTGQITTETAESAAVKKMVETGDIEISDEQSGSSGPGDNRLGSRGLGGHAQGGGSRRSGDR
jgi:hypothetical protein